MTTQERSDAAHSVIEAAAEELSRLGMEGAAPWRMMAWNAFDRLRHEQCETHGRETCCACGGCSASISLSLARKAICDELC